MTEDLSESLRSTGFLRDRRAFLAIAGAALATSAGCTTAEDGDAVGDDANDDGVDDDDTEANGIFAVSVTNAPEFVTDGGAFEISYRVENTGDAETTQTVAVSVDGVTQEKTELAVSGGESHTREVTVGIDASDEGIGESVSVTVSSDDDVDAVTILSVTQPTDGGVLDVVAWNRALLRIVRLTAETPTETVRRIAILTTAMYDAVASVEAARGTAQYETYHRYDDEPPGDASPLAALGGAARNALTGMYPEFVHTFDRRLEITLARAAELDGDVETGETWGRAVGQRTVVAREDDGHTEDEPGGYHPCPGDDPNETPGCWRGGNIGSWRDSHYAFLDTWVLEEPMAADGPPPLDSEAYAESWHEVYELGDDRADRPEAWGDIAQFWRGGPGTARPSGRWLEISCIAVESEAFDLSLLEVARLNALVGLGLGDAGVTMWREKHAFGYWRPAEAIAAGDTDGNPETFADPDWKPLSVGGNPEYPSALACYGATARTILASVLGTDEFEFEMHSSGPPEMTRTFASFGEALEESIQSRLYLGNHFGFALEDGREMGEEIGTAVFANALRPIG